MAALALKKMLIIKTMHQFTRVTNINKLSLEFLPQTPYSPDLVPSDYFLFRNLKEGLGGERCANNEYVECAIGGYFKELDSSRYKLCFEASNIAGKSVSSQTQTLFEK